MLNSIHLSKKKLKSRIASMAHTGCLLLHVVHVRLYMLTGYN